LCRILQINFIATPTVHNQADFSFCPEFIQMLNVAETVKIVEYLMGGFEKLYHPINRGENGTSCFRSALDLSNA